jgi:hypothetical protein
MKDRERIQPWYKTTIFGGQRLAIKNSLLFSATSFLPPKNTDYDWWFTKRPKIREYIRWPAPVRRKYGWPPKMPMPLVV